jgi:hypothetical protein
LKTDIYPPSLFGSSEKSSSIRTRRGRPSKARVARELRVIRQKYRDAMAAKWAGGTRRNSRGVWE